MATATIGTTYASQAMFKVGGPLFSLYMEDETLYQLLKGNTKLTGGFFYEEETGLAALGWSGKPTTEGGARPVFRVATPQLAKWDMYRMVSPFQISDDAMVMGNLIGPKGVNVRAAELVNCMESFKWMFARGLIGQHTGDLARCLATDGSTTIVVDDVSPFRKDMYIDTGITTTVGDSYRITAIDETTRTLTVTGGTGTIAVGHYIRGEDYYNLMPYGLRDILNPNADQFAGDYVIARQLDTYANISRETNPRWMATVYQKGGPGALSDFDPKMLAKTLTAHNMRLGKRSGVKVALCTWEMAETMAGYITVNPRDNDKTKVVIGTSGVRIVSTSVAGGEIAVAPVAGYTKYVVDLIDTSDIAIRWVAPPNWMPGKGGEVLQYNQNEYTGYDTWTGSYGCKWNLTAHPHMHASLVGVNVDEAFRDALPVEQ